jgi:hypothetical protein
MRYSGYDLETINNIYDSQQKNEMKELAVEFEENVVDPMLLLNLVNSRVDIYAIAPVAEAMLGGRTAKFFLRGASLGEFHIPPKPCNFGNVFAGKPYLLDALFRAVYASTLGKLSLPSSVLGRQEDSAETAAEAAKGKK